MSRCCCVCQENGDAEYIDFMLYEMEAIESSLENIRRSTVQQVGRIQQQLMSALSELQQFEEGIYKSLNEMADRFRQLQGQGRVVGAERLENEGCL